MSFVAVAALQAWPLPLHLNDRITGDPASDAGVYVWNLWVFHHELVERGTNPLTTDTILAAGGATDLSLHNYTVASDVLALPLLPIVGVVTAFNLIYLINVALAGFGVFLLARRVHRRQGIGDAEAWLAGLLFSVSPFLVARGTAHFSLVAAAPLPFFAFFFDRAWRDRRLPDAAAAGACIAWAAYSDPYYAIYCVLLAVCVAASDLTVRVDPVVRTGLHLPTLLVDSLLGVAAVVVAAVAIFDVDALRIGSVQVSMRSLYTPVLVLTTIACARMLMAWRPRFAWRPTPTAGQMLRIAVVIGAVGGLLLAPLLHAMVVRVMEGRLVTAPVLWRSSAPGLDVLAFLAPNPHHPLAPRAILEWLTAQPGRENVASIPWVAMGVILAAWRWSASPARRLWLWTAVFFALLALGPFVRIGGILTYLPTPWTFLRYVPVLGEARMPARFAVVVIMAVAIVFAGAIAGLARRAPHRRLLLGGVAAALVFELLPVPRTLYSAEVPAIYRTIASDARPVSVLELPFGLKDGLTFHGDFTARSMFHQTAHGKSLVGGYLSRVSDQKKEAYLTSPVLGTLIDLSEGESIGAEARAGATAAAPGLVRQVQLGYVVMHTARTPPELRRLAVEMFALERLDAGGGYELFRVGRSAAGEHAPDQAAHDPERIED